MEIVLNGERREVADDATVTALLAQLAIAAERVAVEVNEQVVKRAAHADTRLQAGDRVEVVTFVGGG